MPISPDMPGSEHNRMPEIESHSEYVNLFLRADASIAAAVSLKEMERIGAEPTPWQIAFERMHSELERKLRNVPGPHHPRQLVTGPDAFVTRPASVIIASNEFDEGKIDRDAIESLLHVVYMLGHELHSREDIQQYFPSILAILENFGGLHVQNSHVTQGIIGQILGVGHLQWREQNPIPKGFKIVYDWRIPVDPVFQKGVGDLPQPPGENDPPSAFSEFFKELDLSDLEE